MVGLGLMEPYMKPMRNVDSTALDAAELSELPPSPWPCTPSHGCHAVHVHII